MRNTEKFKGNPGFSLSYVFSAFFVFSVAEFGCLLPLFLTAE